MKKQKKQLLELAKEAYNSSDVCQQWKDKILEVCPELRLVLKEKGKWYINSNGGFLHNYQGYCSYGFNWKRNWSNILQTNKFMDDFRPATDKEVEEALIKEAKKRYKIGDKIKFFNQENNENDLKGFSLDFINEENVLSATCYGYDCLFDNGKWAEIVSEPVKKMTVSEICKELGYDVEIIKD